MIFLPQHDYPVGVIPDECGECATNSGCRAKCTPSGKSLCVQGADADRRCAPAASACADNRGCQRPRTGTAASAGRIMSGAMNWPRRIPASNPSAARSTSSSLAAISTSTSGWPGRTMRSRAPAGSAPPRAALRGAKIWPAVALGHARLRWQRRAPRRRALHAKGIARRLRSGRHCAWCG
jgi:hypothetical protein